MKLEDKDILFYDDETSGLDEVTDRLHGIAIAFNNEKPAYYPAWDIPKVMLDRFADPNVIKVGFNERFDRRFATRAGIKIEGIIYDVMHMMHQVDENGPRGLKGLSEAHIGPGSLDNKRLLDKAMASAGVKDLGAFCFLDLLHPEHPYLQVIGNYSVEDVENTRTLFWIAINRLRAIHKSLTTKLKVKETPLTNYLKDIVPTESVLLDMELSGIRVDTVKIDKVKNDNIQKRDACLVVLNEKCAERMKLVEKDLTTKAILDHIKKLKTPEAKLRVEKDLEGHRVEFNWESNGHVGRLFFDHFDVSPSLARKTKNGYALDETYLKNLPDQLNAKHPLREILPTYAIYKKTLKLIGTYTGSDKKGIVSRIRKASDGTPTVYALFPQTTNSGRLAPSRPNMANLPRTSPVKSFFIPKLSTNKFLYADFSQLQLRIAAHESKDPVLMEAYQLDLDVHAQTAATMLRIPEKELLALPEAEKKEKRQFGKTGNFSAIFGAATYKLLLDFKEKNGMEYTYDEVDAFRNAIFASWSGYKKYLDDQLRFVKKYGFVISSTGRVRRLPDIAFGNFLNHRTKQFTGPKELWARVQEAIRTQSYAKHLRKYSREELPYRIARAWYQHAVNQAYCTPIQNMESSIVKRCMVELWKRKYHLVNQMHDAIIVEVPVKKIADASVEIEHVLANTFKLCVPLKAEVKVLNSFEETDLFE